AGTVDRLEEDEVRAERSEVRETQLTSSPWLAPAVSRTQPSPSFPRASRTRSVEPAGESRTTQPPPPAPQAFPAHAPASRAAAMARSIVGVETTGASPRRASHSSAIARPISGTSGPPQAP